MNFFLRVVVNMAALWVATSVVPGVTYNGGWLTLLAVAVVFGVVNTIVGAVAKILTFPIIIVTLGVFLLVINGLMLWLTSRIAEALDLGFSVSGFWPAFWGALVVSVVSTILGWMVAHSGRERTYRTGR